MKAKFVSLLCATLLFLLCACAQSQVNTDRLLDNSNGLEAGPADASNFYNGKEEIQDDLSIPNELDEHTETLRNVFEMDFFGYGRIRYFIEKITLADSMDAAGIDENAYALSGSKKYDHYITISIAIENLEIPVDDEENTEGIRRHSLINLFQLQYAENGKEIPSFILEPQYFDKGGLASTDAARYFEYDMPDIGETLSAVLAFGFPNEVLDTMQADDTTLYLVNTITGEKMEITNLL